MMKIVGSQRTKLKSTSLTKNCKKSVEHLENDYLFYFGRLSVVDIWYGGHIIYLIQVAK